MTVNSQVIVYIKLLMYYNARTQENDLEFEVSLRCIVRPCLKNHYHSKQGSSY
jgi:hypothetical protein